MAIAIIDPTRLRELVGRLVAGRAEALPHGLHAELVAVLTSALMGPAARDEYVAALEEAHRFTGTTPPADPVADIPETAFLRDGPAALPEELLVRIARRPDAVRALSDRVTLAMAAGELGEGWWEAAAPIAGPVPESYLGPEVIARNRERLRRLISGGDGDLLAADRADHSPQRNRARWLGRAGLGFALAASVFIAFCLGAQWGGREGRADVHLASVALRGEPTRGIEKVAIDVKNGSDERVFLTVVGLIPGRRTPGYLYRQEGRYIEVPPRGSTTVTNLSREEFEGTTVLLVFATHFPAGGIIRECTPPTATPESAQQDAEQIRRTLTELGIPTDVQVVPLPPAKR